MFPPYVVTSLSRRPAPQPMGLEGRRERATAHVPLGVRHALASSSTSTDGSPGRVALCGQPVGGWFVFLALAFTGGDPADCRRCEQVMRVRSRRPGVAAGE